MAEMAVEAIPEIAGAMESAGGAAGGAAEGGAAEGGGSGSDLFGDTPEPGQSEQGKQQNVGASRNMAFQSAAMSVRGAMRPSAPSTTMSSPSAPGTAGDTGGGVD